MIFDKIVAMSLLDQLKLKKSNLKSTITNITHADGSQEQIILSKNGDEVKQTSNVQLKPKTYGFVVDTKPDQVPACIIDDFLYLGSQDSVMLENVNKFGLTDVLSVGIPAPISDISFNDGSDSTIHNHYVDCLDLPDTQLLPILKETNEIINNVKEKNGRILVHCNAGVSRSSTVCIGFLMQNEQMDFESAFQLVKSKRECIRPNDGFYKQLKEFQPCK